MSKFFHRIIDLIIKPVKENLIFFCMIYLLGMITTFTQVIELHCKLPRINFFSWIFDLYLICLILYIFPKRIQKYLKIFISACFYTLAIVDAFLNKFFYAKVGPEILNLILETNSKESNEFIDKYININIFCSSISIIVIWIVTHIILSYHSNNLYKKITTIPHQTLCKVTFAGIVIVSVGFCIVSRIQIVQLVMAQTTEEADLYIRNRSINTPANNLILGFKMRELAEKDFGKLAEIQKNVTVDDCLFSSKHIILIIGESYIKSHSQLYGYQFPTTPMQLKRFQKEKDGELIPYTDVISPSNLTSIVFKNTFSLHSVEDKSSWVSFALFPVLFKKAGYHVTFITNQFVKSPQQDIFNITGGLFLNDNRLNNVQFDSRNTSTHKFDEDLLTDYDSLMRYNTGKDLTIFHLAGQHIDFSKRYPDNMNFFQISNYQNRKDLNDEEKQILADYDNATLYNDFVVESIISRFKNEDAIIIYMPDHGEECYDGIHRMGRLQSNYSPQMVVNEFEIPFWIWLSDSYITSHQQVYRQIKEACNRPFMTDDLPHLLLYLAGIQCKDYQEKRNIISPKYNSKRKRIVNGGVDFDKMRKGL